MASAFYPLGMSSYGNRLPQGGYKTSRGSGVFSNPTGITATHIRPLTNKDYGNVFPGTFGKARPMKHYRRGTGIAALLALQAEIDQAAAADDDAQVAYLKGVDYNVHRAVKSATNSALDGGIGTIAQLIDYPGAYSVQANTVGQTTSSEPNCKDCAGIGMVSSQVPVPSLTETPQAVSTSKAFCCNLERNARKRVLPANTNLPKTYYQTTGMYLYNRCQTFKQRQFNFFQGVATPDVYELLGELPLASAAIGANAKPGSPLAILNQYVAQCNPNGAVNCGVRDNYVNAIARALLSAGVITPQEFVDLQNQGITLPLFLSLLAPLLTAAQFTAVEKYLFDKAQNQNLNARNCGRVEYKPSNWQYAKEGAVSSGARLLKLNVDTAATTAKFTAKVKPTVCQPQTYSGNPFFFSGQFQNKRTCNNRGD
jgi:hypothetical protein